MSSQLLPSPRRGSSPLVTVLDRMVATELAKTLISVLLVLVVIIVSQKFLDILGKAIEGEISADTVFKLLGLKLLTATTTLIPAATFVAVLTVLGRMYRDQEMSILASGGVGPSRLYRALAWLVVPVGLLAGVLALEALPWAERQAQALLKQDEKGADIRGIKAGRFNEFSQGDVVLYAAELAGENDMREIFVQSRQGKNVGVVAAEQGRLHENELGEHFVVLNRGRRYQGIPGRVDFVISEFDEYGVRIDGPESEAAARKREAEDSVVLWRSQTPRELAELQKRLAIPLGVAFLTLLSVPLARMAPRSGVYGNVFTAFLIYIVYENAQKISQGLLMTGKLPFWHSYSGVYLALLLVTLLLFLRNLGFRWLLRAFRSGGGR
jgi:lipopolysaccharide export system permease protein